MIGYFFLYSFLGWIIDTTYRSFVDSAFAPGPYLHPLPFTPMYGFGALLILLTYPSVKSLPLWQLFFFYAISLSFFEYMGAIFSLSILGVRLWDYSDGFLNIQGHTDLLHGLAWGALALLMIKCIHPFFEHPKLPL